MLCNCALHTLRNASSEFSLLGIAVSAGELDEQQAEQLAETREQLNDALKSLHAARQENQELRARFAFTQGTEAARDEL